MSLERTQLRKILQIVSSPEKRQLAIIRSDAMATMRKDENGPSKGGGDFHVPFWSDAKRHVLNGTSLIANTDLRMDQSAQRKRLYPLLTSNFMAWWIKERGSFNADLQLFDEQISGKLSYPTIRGVVRVDNLLTYKIAGVQRRFVYPYFSEYPALSPEAARLGVWAVTKSLEKYDPQLVSVVDVLRGIDHGRPAIAMYGNEETIFQQMYSAILERWRSYFPS